MGNLLTNRLHIDLPMETQFFWPVRVYYDTLLVSAEVAELRRASLIFAQEIRLDDPAGDKLCEATIHIACVTDGGFRSAAIPGFLVERIKDAI